MSSFSLAVRKETAFRIASQLAARQVQRCAFQTDGDGDPIHIAAALVVIVHQTTIPLSTWPLPSRKEGHVIPILNKNDFHCGEKENETTITFDGWSRSSKE